MSTWHGIRSLLTPDYLVANARCSRRTGSRISRMQHGRLRRRSRLGCRADPSVSNFFVLIKQTTSFGKCERQRMSMSILGCRKDAQPMFCGLAQKFIAILPPPRRCGARTRSSRRRRPFPSTVRRRSRGRPCRRGFRSCPPLSREFTGKLPWLISVICVARKNTHG